MPLINLMATIVQAGTRTMLASSGTNGEDYEIQTDC